MRDNQGSEENTKAAQFLNQRARELTIRTIMIHITSFLMLFVPIPHEKNEESFYYILLPLATCICDISRLRRVSGPNSPITSGRNNLAGVT